MKPRSAIALCVAPLACLALAGCGGGQAASTARTPLIGHELARQLAGRASAVEASLNRRDGCRALQQATALKQAEADAISAGQIPIALRAPLVSSTQTLVRQIQCVPPPPNPPAPRHHHHHDHHHKPHGHKEGD
jgi:hypothetical protein